MSLPRSAKEAKDQKSPVYFTGLSCKHGHVANRYASNHGCTVCIEQRSGSPEYQAKRAVYEASPAFKESIRRSTQKTRSTPEGREAHRLEKKSLETKKREVAHNKERRRTDPQYRIACYLRARQRIEMRKGEKGKQRVGSFVKNLGCTIHEAMKYWESLPTWNPNWAWADQGKQFHLDHVVPLALFNLTEEKQFLQAAHYTNQQPLSVEEHKAKTASDLLLIKNKEYSDNKLIWASI